MSEQHTSAHPAGEYAMPPEVHLVRTTTEFDEHSAPVGFERAHRLAANVWGRLVVRSGELDFRFEDSPCPRRVSGGESVVIPPKRPHRLILGRPVRFAVEFYRSDSA